MEMYFAYTLELSGTETDYNKQLEIINDTDKLKTAAAQVMGYESFSQLLSEMDITEDELDKEVDNVMKENNVTYNQALCALAVEIYQPITVNVSNGDSFKVGFGDIMDSEPYEYTASEEGTLTFVATGPQGMTGSIDIEFTAAKVKLTVKHINKSGAELKETTETEYDKDTAVTVKSETISGYKTYSAKITATEVNETLTEGAPVELSFGIYMDTEVVITYDVLQSGETEKEYEEKPTVSNSTEPVRVKPVAKDSSIKESLPTDIKNSDNSYMVDIEPVKSNSGPLTITLDVSDKAEDGDTANVRHYKNSVWDNLGDFIVSEGKITFTIDSFSPFCITIKKKGSSTGGNDNPSTTSKISTLVETVVDKNTKAEDAYGNKITIPKGFKILEHNPTSSTGAVTYNYTNSEETGEHIPAVQDGIVIEDTQTETAGNQFVWAPVGTIKNKDNNTTSTITLGRYSKFTATNGEYTPAQVASVENCTQTVTIINKYQELSTFRAGNSKTDSTAQNATARNLSEFISTTLANGGYYIARFEASKNTTTNKIESQYNKMVLTSITQPNAAKAARNMYGEIKENNKLVYASDLVNSYAWDTAIIFIQTYSTGENASSYASKNKSTSRVNIGKNDGKYCNIWDMSGKAYEWTTEYSTDPADSYSGPCVRRGGYYATDYGRGYGSSASRGSTNNSGIYSTGLRPLLYAK